MENKKVNIVLFILLIIIIVTIIVLVGKYNKQIAEKAQEIVQNTIAPALASEDDNIKIVPTLDDKIKGNTMWCGTFQLIWNDLKDNIVKQDIEFSPQLDCVDNLNKSKFTKDMISEEDYYKNYGIISEELKNQIETDLMNKFGKTSEFINKFNWSNEQNETRYFLYSTLIKDLKFAMPFDDLETGDFAGKDTKTSYFGLKQNSNLEAREQVQVLYYNNEDDKAISIQTTTNDEIILCRTNTAKNFNQIIQKIDAEKKNYKDSTTLKLEEILKIPEISINSEKEFKDTSTNTPCLVTRGASCTFKKDINAANNTHVISSELNNGTSYFLAMVINSSTGCKLRQNITAGGRLESRASNTSTRFSLSHSSSK